MVFFVGYIESIFINCIEYFTGTCNKRREEIETNINELFQEFLDQEFAIEEAYGYMVSARPSKVLSGWTYESQPKPLRSSRTAGDFCETDVPETEDEKSDFNEFAKLLQNGQRIADETKKTNFFMWRGYRACISSGLPKLSAIELDRRYKLAMDSINKSAKTETEASSSQTAPGTAPSQVEDGFKKPYQPPSSSSCQSSSSSSGRLSSQSILSDSEEITQIPETQFDMDSKSFTYIYTCFYFESRGFIEEGIYFNIYYK